MSSSSAPCDVADTILRMLLQPPVEGSSLQLSHCCALVARTVRTFIWDCDVDVTLTNSDGRDVGFHGSEIDRGWSAFARTMATVDPTMFSYSPTGLRLTDDDDWLHFDVLLPTVGTVNVRAHFTIVKRTPRFCCRACGATYKSLLNARSCGAAHTAVGADGRPAGPEREVDGRRARMVSHWDGLGIADRRRVAAFALEDISTICGDLLGIHHAILKAICGALDGKGLVAALEEATEGTMLLPGFGSGTAENLVPRSRGECEAVVAWWTAARLSSEAMAHVLLLLGDEENTTGTKPEKKKKKKKKTARKKTMLDRLLPPPCADMELPWSVLYTWPEPVRPGEFDPAAAVRFLERRAQEVIAC